MEEGKLMKNILNLFKNIVKKFIHIFIYVWNWTTYSILKLFRMMPTINSKNPDRQSDVDKYWGWHTVNSRQFLTATQSRRYLDWRKSLYPKFPELMGIYGIHDDETILDYGCGPGSDITGFLIYTNARKVIGMDVSMKALKLTQYRLGLHRIKPARIELIHISDSSQKIPLEDESIDYINSGGVIHHTSEPESILKNFHRVQKTGGEARIMVYNYNSLWLHLYTAYEKMIKQAVFQGLSVLEAFSLNTDGEECPISRCYHPEKFIAMCKEAGFIKVEFLGGYLSTTELDCLRNFGEAALSDDGLQEEHKEFIRNLEYDSEGLPMYKGKYAGVGGVYRLRK
jgi:ubiquinone/menaquinone biosynthesis C-methylase UbiE